MLITNEQLMQEARRMVLNSTKYLADQTARGNRLSKEDEKLVRICQLDIGIGASLLRTLVDIERIAGTALDVIEVQGPKANASLQEPQREPSPVAIAQAKLERELDETYSEELRRR
jgi:hypothetical protein